nr:tRNA lysidine(34) synthetase TilS [Lysinibacillus timonensis]
MVSFENNVLQFINEHELINKGDRLLIACSGGIDSMGLLHFFLECGKTLGVQIFVAHVDHMLRGEASAEDRRFVEDFCRQHNVEIFSTAISIPQLLDDEGGNSQAICRRERYAFFSEIMEKYSINHLVTAHHADDQLESLLMSLTRAGSLLGMKGMYAKRAFSNGTIIRPFLSVTKVEIKNYLEQKGGTYREDSSNEKDDYTRNRFRHHILPFLKQENRNVSTNAVKFTHYLQEDDDYLFTLAKNRFSSSIEKLSDGEYRLNLDAFESEPCALQRRLILILLNYIYQKLQWANSDTLLKSILQLSKSREGSATIHLPEDYVAIRRYSEILFFKKKTNEIPLEKILYLNEWYELQNRIRIYIGENSSVIEPSNLVNSMEYYFSSSTFKAPYRVRSRREGDRIALKGMSQSKRLSRLFIDEKIPLNERDKWPILVDSNDEVIAVLGVRVNKNLSKMERPQDDIKIIIEYNIN